MSIVGSYDTPEFTNHVSLHKNILLKGKEKIMGN